MTPASLKIVSRRGSVSRNSSAWRTICDGSPCRTTCTPWAAQKRVWSWSGSSPQMVRGPAKSGGGAVGATGEVASGAGDGDCEVGGAAVTSISDDGDGDSNDND